MKICVTAQGDHLDAQIDPRFGRSRYFLFVDTATMEFEAVSNENVAGMGGVGVQSGQLAAEKGAGVVLTGKVGPNASQTLQAAGIKVIVDVQGSVRDAIEKYKRGEFVFSAEPNAQEKSGLK